MRDLLYGLILRSGNDAAYDLALAAAGSEARFVRQMNRYAAALGLADTHYANPIGLDQEGNYSSARDLATLSRRLLRDPAFARIADARSARLRSLRPPRTIDTLNDLLYRAPWTTGVKTGHTFGAAYVLVGSGQQDGVKLISVVIGAPTETERDLASLRLLEYGFSRYERRVPVRHGERLAAPSIRYAGGELPLRAARGVAIGLRPDQKLSVAVRAPEEVEGPIRRGAKLGSVDRLRRRPPCRDGAAAGRPRRGRGEHARSGRELPRSRPDSDRDRHLRDTDRSSSAEALLTMILTVTLNAAIDRTVAVPNFRLGHRHRAVESRTVAGGKGINVARALNRLGRPVIAAGFAGGPTGNRLLEQLREEAVLTDFTRIAAETRINLAVIDPTSGEQTEINERGPAVSREEVEVFVARLGYLADGAQLCVLAGTLPPGAGADLYARLVKDLGERGVPVVLDAEGEAMLAGLRAGAAIVTPNEREAEELVGQEFADRDDLVHGLSELVRLGAGRGGDHASRRLRRGDRRGG